MVQWISSEEMNTVTLAQILDEAVYISHGANILGNESNYSPPTYGRKRVGQTGIFSFSIANGLVEGKLWIKNWTCVASSYTRI